MNKLQKAKEEGKKHEYAKALWELFSNQNFNSFVTGTEEQTKALYQEIANMSPEEAQKAGLNTEEGPNNYKTKAEEAIKDIEVLGEMYDEVTYRYNSFDDEAAATQYGERVFAFMMEGYGAEKQIKDIKKQYEELKQKHYEHLQARGITNLTWDEAFDMHNKFD
jgi:hypothetical protein